MICHNKIYLRAPPPIRPCNIHVIALNLKSISLISSRTASYSCALRVMCFRVNLEAIDYHFVSSSRKLII